MNVRSSELDLTPSAKDELRQEACQVLSPSVPLSPLGPGSTKPDEAKRKPFTFEPLKSNPFRALREANQATMAAWALRLGLPMSSVTLAEYGAPAYPRRLLQALAQHGHDPSELLRAYTAWRLAQAAPLEVAR